MSITEFLKFFISSIFFSNLPLAAVATYNGVEGYMFVADRYLTKNFGKLSNTISFASLMKTYNIWDRTWGFFGTLLPTALQIFDSISNARPGSFITIDVKFYVDKQKLISIFEEVT